MRVMRPSLTTSESAARWPSSLTTTSPSRPLSPISIGSCTYRRLSAAHPRATRAPPRSGVRAAGASPPPSDVQTTGVEHGHEALEVALADRLRERSHGAIVLVARGREARALALDVAAGARGELPHRLGRAADHLGDVAERHVEHVVQHERRALRGRELLEHGQQRVADRLVERHAVRRIV